MPNEIDAMVGYRIRKQREKLGLTEQEFAAAIGASTTEQLQRHESGDLRVDAKRLFTIKTLLRVELSYFFRGTEPD